MEANQTHFPCAALKFDRIKYEDRTNEETRSAFRGKVSYVSPSSLNDYRVGPAARSVGKDYGIRRRGQIVANVKLSLKDLIERLAVRPDFEPYVVIALVNYRSIKVSESSLRKILE
jgi:hypothetical protein